MSEKQTEYYGRNYITKLLNIKSYNTKGNKTLFNSGIPDGWLMNSSGDNLLIIEYKASNKKNKEGIKQLYHYYSTAKCNNSKLNIFCFLGVGDTEETFKPLLFTFGADGKMIKINETKIKESFIDIASSVGGSMNTKTIHDMLVKNFHFDKASELHKLLTIIITSFINNDLIKYYELKEDMINKEFIDLLINNARRYLGEEYEKYITTFAGINRDNCFKLCQTIYKTYKYDPHIISNLFQQFKQFNKYEAAKNEVWTDPLIANIMFNELVKLTGTKDLTVCDPCIGGGNLLQDFINSCENLKIKGCEYNENTATNIKLELIIKGFDTSNIYYNDYFNIEDNNLIADCVICNPPYSSNIIANNYKVLDFVIKSLHHSKYCCYIIPKNKLLTEKKQMKKLLKISKILKIINIGKIFKKNKGTGDIIIILLERRNKEDTTEIETEFINIPEISDHYCKVLKKDEYYFDDEGKKLIDDLFNNKIEIIKYFMSSENVFPNEQNDSSSLEYIKGNIIKEYNKTLSTVLSLPLLTTDEKDIINNIFVEKLKNIDQFLTIDNLNNQTLKQVKFSNVFEKVKHKITDYRKYDKGEYPFIYRTMLNNGVETYLNYFDVDSKGEDYITIADLSGFSSVHNGKFSVGKDMLLLKKTEQFKDIDLNINSILLNNQLMNNKWCYSNLITYDKIKNDLILIYQSNDNTNKLIASNYKYVNLMDYFETVKFKPVILNKVENGEFPAYGAKDSDEPAKYIKDYNIDTKGENYVQLNKGGSVGHCFIRNGQFNMTSSVYLLKPIKEIDLNVNIKLMTLQISNMGFSWGNAINSERLNNIKLYLYINT